MDYAPGPVGHSTGPSLTVGHFNAATPDAYLDFLRWSNGGEFCTGERTFYPMLPCEEIVRDWILGYSLPLYVPMAFPFALNGGGSFFAFGMREESVGGEYPVIFIDSGARDYACAAPVAASFLEACRGRTAFI